jgi:hypothetical protein
VSYGDLKQIDKAKFTEERYTIGPYRKIDNEHGLDAKCEGCHHPRDGRCPYVLSPKFRFSWPCFFRNHVEKSEPLEMPKMPQYTGNMGGWGRNYAPKKKV